MYYKLTAKQFFLIFNLLSSVAIKPFAPQLKEQAPKVVLSYVLKTKQLQM